MHDDLFLHIHIDFNNCLFNSKIHEMVASFTTHMHTDLQQRGIEYNQLFNRYNHMREGLLERMPAMESNKTQQSQWNETNEDIPSPNDLISTEVTNSETNDSVWVNYYNKIIIGNTKHFVILERSTSTTRRWKWWFRFNS